MNALVVMGSAPCAIDDADRLPADRRYDYAAVGLAAAGLFSKDIVFLATYHPAEIDEARKRRLEKGWNADYRVVSHVQFEGRVDCVTPYRPPSGSSALLAVLAGRHFGYSRIILCGCPLLDKNYVNFQKGWQERFDEIKDYVRSMSGWTGELLGAPTEEWLDERSN